MPAYLQISALPTSSAGCRSRLPTRWSALKAAPTCCAVSAGCAPPRPHYSGGAVARARADLAIAADARRHRARRLLEASGADDGGRDQRLGAVAQALPMAGLF